MVVGAGELLVKEGVMAIQVQRILVPMDSSEHCKQALTFANKLAKDLDSEVELVHGMECPP